MYRKWLGWKKVAVCLVGAAMVMQGASMTMAADEYPTEQNEPDYANEDQTAEDTAEGSTDSDEDSEDQSTSDEDTGEDTDEILPMKTLFMRKQTRILLMRIPTVSQM